MRNVLSRMWIDVYKRQAIELAKENGDLMSNYSVNDQTNMNIVVPVTGINLNKTSTTIAKGQTEKLTASLTPSDASGNVQWLSLIHI